MHNGLSQRADDFMDHFMVTHYFTAWTDAIFNKSQNGPLAASCTIGAD